MILSNIIPWGSTRIILYTIWVVGMLYVMLTRANYYTTKVIGLLVYQIYVVDDDTECQWVLVIDYIEDSTKVLVATIWGGTNGTIIDQTSYLYIWL